MKVTKITNRSSEKVILEMTMEEATFICEHIPQYHIDMIPEFTELYDLLDIVVHE